MRRLAFIALVLAPVTALGQRTFLVGGPEDEDAARFYRLRPEVRAALCWVTTPTGPGQGVLVGQSSTKGLILTASHVVDGGKFPDQITVTFPDGFSSAATLGGHDPVWDLAALVVWRPNASPVPLAVRQPQKGDLITLGTLYGRRSSQPPGYPSGLGREPAGPVERFTSPVGLRRFECVEFRPANSQWFGVGDSGAGMFTERGELVGIMVSRSDDGLASGPGKAPIGEFLAKVFAQHRMSAEILCSPCADGQCSWTAQGWVCPGAGSDGTMAPPVPPSRIFRQLEPQTDTPPPPVVRRPVTTTYPDPLPPYLTPDHYRQLSGRLEGAQTQLENIRGGLDRLREALEKLELTPGPDGPPGAPGKDGSSYTLTEADKIEIAKLAWSVIMALPEDQRPDVVRVRLVNVRHLIWQHASAGTPEAIARAVNADHPQANVIPSQVAQTLANPRPTGLPEIEQTIKLGGGVRFYQPPVFYSYPSE